MKTTRDEKSYERLRRMPVPDALLQDLSDAPLIPEHEIGVYIEANGAGKSVGGHRESPRDLWPHTGRRRLLLPSEKRLIRLLAAGLKEPQIACALGLKYQTVRNELRRARYRLGVRNQTQLVAVAIREKMVR